MIETFGFVDCECDICIYIVNMSWQILNYHLNYKLIYWPEKGSDSDDQIWLNYNSVSKLHEVLKEEKIND